ncbi:MAG TPA: hypothetical protein VIY48_00595 [Candidatus Paceibacterota bacterium]
MILYKITPNNKTVEAHTYDGEYSGMKPLLPYAWLDHARATSRGDMFFVNDTGLIDGTEEKDGAFWWLHENGVWQKFVGEALLWGTRGPENADPSLTLDQARARISYMKPNGAEEPNILPEVQSFDSPEEMIRFLTGQ